MSGLVSVIIPFYNAEKFLSEAIQSVIEQTYHHWELLLVDDGSSDSSTQIALKYAQQKSHRIFYLEHPLHQRKGVSASRNLGISGAKGELIAFVDADDIWLPEKLQEQVEIMTRFPEAAMLYGPALYWYSWSGNAKDKKLDLVQELGVENNQLFKPPSLLLSIDPLGKGSSACPSSMMIRKETLNRVGGFEEQLAVCEDQAFCTKLFLKENVYVAGDCLVKYRRHPHSVMEVVRRSGRYSESHLLFLRWVTDFLNQNGVEDAEAWRALRRAMWPYQHPSIFRIKGICLEPLRLLKRVALRVLGPAVYHRIRRTLGNSRQPLPPTSS